jgi:hypothetical protein
LALRRELNSRQGVAETLHELGVVAAHQGDYTSARTLLSEGLTLRTTVGDRAGIAYSLAALAWLTQIQPSASRADLEHAVQLLAASETLIQSIGVQPAKADQEQQAAVRAAAQKKLGKSAFTAAWNAGRRLSLEEALLQQPATVGNSTR